MLVPMSTATEAAKRRAIRFARYFIKQRGAEAFIALVKMFRDNKTPSDIGYVFAVHRQAVHTWRQRLGERVTVWMPHAEIEKLIDVSNGTVIDGMR